jgi:hypothetical protein
MDKTDKLIEQTERLLTQVEMLQQMMKQLQLDLNRHELVLEQQLTRLRTKKEKEPTLKPLSTPERRTTPRRKGNPVSVHLIDGAEAGVPFEGWVVDRSSGGLRLLVDEAVPAGTLLKVRPTKSATKFPWIKVKVKSCYPERKSWNLGCQFLEKMTWEDLQQFG